MAQDFGKPYSGIQYFSGLWDDGTPDTLGKRDAMAVLAEAVPLCGEEDQRQRRDVQDALAYLERYSGCTARLNAFRRALDANDPSARLIAVTTAYNALAATMARP